MKPSRDKYTETHMVRLTKAQAAKAAKKAERLGVGVAVYIRMLVVADQEIGCK